MRTLTAESARGRLKLGDSQPNYAASTTDAGDDIKTLTVQ